MKKVIWLGAIVLALSGCVANEYVKGGADYLGLSDTYEMAAYDSDGWSRITEEYNGRSVKINKFTETSFDKEGYDFDGFDKYGFNREGIHRETGSKYAKDGYDVKGFDKNGNRKPIPGITIPLKGYENFKYDSYTGWSLGFYKLSNGEEKMIHRKTGTIYDDKGFSWNGIHRETGTRFDPEGYNEEGFNDRGWNREGINYSTDYKYDRDGYDVNGYDRNGLDKNGNFKTGRAYDAQGYDKLGWNKSKTKHRSGKTINDKPNVQVKSSVRDDQVYLAVMAAYGVASVPVTKDTVGFEYHNLKVNGKPVSSRNGEYDYTIPIGRKNILSYTVVVFEKDYNGRRCAASELTKEVELYYKDLYEWSKRTNDTTLSLNKKIGLSAY
ncbi:hypothetical protein PM10SUCC1_33000 [Propionigenium maris DSM 9537]|uniref:Uncharacterized protein n=1 Tax=Propionigenium maris DSM 9537 TaxID=1123000 RepID=A0A9W6GPU3_9FUSO|nr:hypothetical protein [Propionigenium maris]GLI57786.1 hypothetical protein PM10SUCC1_33000 [Propionigenium maris DSM 9537]